MVSGGVLSSFTGCKPTARQPKLSPLAMLVDTIIPQDDFAGAINLGLGPRLVDEIGKSPQRKEQLERLLTQVSALSLRQYQSEFIVLNQDQREKLLNDILLDKGKLIVRRDLRKLRTTLLNWYYQSEIGAASIGYQLPADYPAYPG